MHRFRAWGLAALAAAAGATTAAADPPRAARPGTPTTVYDKFFGKGRAKADPAPADAAKTAATPAAPAAPVAPALTPEMRAAALRDEQDALNRRMAVCTKLREAAAERNDEALFRQVDDLERQATALYRARTDALGIPRISPADVLDRQLGTGVAVTPLTAPAAPVPAGPATAAARATAPTGGDVREVRP